MDLWKNILIHKDKKKEKINKQIKWGFRLKDVRNEKPSWWKNFKRIFYNKKYIKIHFIENNFS